MSLISDKCTKVQYKELKRQLEIEVESQYKLLEIENLQFLQKIGYVRPRTRLQQLYADEYMTDKQFANILGLEKIIKNNPELTDEYIHKFILKHKLTLMFLNHLFKVVPDTVLIIRNIGAKGVVFNYVRRLEEKKEHRKKR